MNESMFTGIFYLLSDKYTFFNVVTWFQEGGARSVMVIVIGNGHGDTSSNLGRSSLHFI